MHNFDVILPRETQSADFYTEKCQSYPGGLEKAIEVILRLSNAITNLAQFHTADASFPHDRVCPAVRSVFCSGRCVKAQVFLWKTTRQ